MPKDTKPTPEQVVRLAAQHDEIHTMVGLMTDYHNKRISFFEALVSIFDTFNVFASVGALLLIGLQLADSTYSIITTSLLPASAAVLLLFLSKSLDFSKKEENHRWLATIYRGYNKELSDIRLIIWETLSAENYRKWKDLHDRIKGGINNLKRTEYPILEFEFYLCGMAEKITEEIEGTVFLRVNRWYLFWANCFSMENAKARFIAKYNDRK